jgi:hypothetical protein
MVHIKSVTISKAAVAEKQMDPAGTIFLSIWAFVFMWILMGAFSDKGYGY